MYKKKSLSIGLIALILLGLATVMVPASVSADTHPTQAMWVDPGSYLTAPELDTLKKGDTFTVDVMINISLPPPPSPNGLFGFDYKLMWDATNINLTSYTTHVPTEWGNFFVPANNVAPYNATHERHWYGVSALTGPTTSPYNGTMSICTYNFHVIKTIVEPDPDEIAKLDLYETKLSDAAGNPVAHTTTDALYRKCARSYCITGDLNCDGIVDIFDVVMVAMRYGSRFLIADINRDGIVDDIDKGIVQAAFGSQPGDPNWNPDADLNGDLIVDSFDMSIVGAQYGKRTKYNPIADVNNDLIIDIYDLVLVTSNFGKRA